MPNAVEDIVPNCFWEHMREGQLGVVQGLNAADPEVVMQGVKSQPLSHIPQENSTPPH